MKLLRTQVYLPSETRRRLRRDPAERGMSPAAYLRDVVEAHYSRRGAPAAPSFGDFIACVDEAPVGDVAAEAERYRDERLLARLRQKLGGSRQRAKAARGSA